MELTWDSTDNLLPRLCSIKSSTFSFQGFSGFLGGRSRSEIFSRQTHRKCLCEEKCRIFSTSSRSLDVHSARNIPESENATASKLRLSSCYTRFFSRWLLASSIRMYIGRDLVESRATRIIFPEEFSHCDEYLLVFHESGLKTPVIQRLRSVRACFVQIGETS